MQLSARRQTITIASCTIITAILLIRFRLIFTAKWRPTFPYFISRNILMKEYIEPPEANHLRSHLISRANATLLSLVRNNELTDLLTTMEDVENTFNSKFNYPWTFINDEPFSREFKTQTSAKTKAKIYYEIIPKDHWNDPDWINQDLVEESGKYLKKEGVQYSSMGSYHRMCRWNSGVFYHHPRLKQFKWYWRVEPKTHYFCDIDYDVFRFMEEKNKTYGFVINLYDSPQSIRTLWPTTLDFIAEHPEYIHSNSAIGWLTHQTRKDHSLTAGGYSTCHFWSNFEIGNMDFWRGEAYSAYFEHLDKAGGFFYERWGDAPVHSIGLGLFEDKNKIHWFRDIGYQHIPYFNCPNSPRCRKCIPGLFSDGTGLSQENCFDKWMEYGMEEEV